MPRLPVFMAMVRMTKMPTKVRDRDFRHLKQRIQWVRLGYEEEEMLFEGLMGARLWKMLQVGCLWGDVPRFQVLAKDCDRDLE